MFSIMLLWIAFLSIIAKTWKQMFFEGQIIKQNMVIHIMEHKQKTLMNLQRLILYEKKNNPKRSNTILLHLHIIL